MPIDIPLMNTDWDRRVAKEARLQLLNRYFEQNPALTNKQVALIARPGMRRFLEVGDGPIRALYSQPGSFEDALFTVSADAVYRVDTDQTLTLVLASLDSPNLFNNVSFAATGRTGSTPEYLFFCSGANLYVYIENSYARGILTGTPANGDTVEIAGIYYQWTTGSVDAGSPAGTLANPWLVAIGVAAVNSLDNLRLALNASGSPGVEYSAVLSPNTQVMGYSVGTTTLIVQAILAGTFGNALTTTATGAVSWGAATLVDGGTPQTTIVPTPDDVGVISVGYIGSFVIVVPAQGQGINGRFYWIEPGETTIDPLNFATAERAPDPVYEVVVFGDNFWLPGQSTTEVWYMTGNADAPVARQQGITFDRGTWAGTALQVKDSMMIVDSDGAVFQIAGGLQRISDPSIEERIRTAIQYQAAQE
jgi:hypothetical protein